MVGLGDLRRGVAGRGGRKRGSGGTMRFMVRGSSGMGRQKER